MPPRASSSSKPSGRHLNASTTGPSSPTLKLPVNWTPEITYLTQPFYSRLLDNITLHHLRPKPIIKGHNDTSHPSGPCPSVKIKKITDMGHPAFAQCGLFANQNLQPGQWVLDYLGYVHPAAETDPDSDYDLSLDRELQGGVGIDARRMGNEARFINDYRGIPERMKRIDGTGKRGKPGPNVLFSERVGERTGERRLCIVVGKEKIKKGEELCLSYGKGFWQARGIGFSTIPPEEGDDPQLHINHGE